MGNIVNLRQAQETTVVQIPFYDQHAGIVRLARHFGGDFVDILKTLMLDTGTIISTVPAVKAVPEQVEVEGALAYNQLIEIYKTHVEHYRETQLTHLKPVDLHIDSELHISLICECTLSDEKLKIPKFVKAVYNNPVNLVDDLISGVEKDLDALWDFIPAAFVSSPDWV